MDTEAVQKRGHQISFICWNNVENIEQNIHRISIWAKNVFMTQLILLYLQLKNNLQLILINNKYKHIFTKSRNQTEGKKATFQRELLFLVMFIVLNSLAAAWIEGYCWYICCIGRKFKEENTNIITVFMGLFAKIFTNNYFQFSIMNKEKVQPLHKFY